MSNYPQRGAPSRFGSGASRKPSFNKKPWGDRSIDRPTVTHKATCSECAKTCEVPFLPNGKKPIYCKDCFGKKMGDSGSDRFPRRDFGAPFRPQAENGRSTDGVAQQLEAVNANLEKLIRAVEALSSGK